MENVFLETAKTIYRNEGNCNEIEYCADCPFDNVCFFSTTEEEKYQLAKKFLTNETTETKNTKEKTNQITIKGITISWDSDKKVDISERENVIKIKIFGDEL